jgi:hypothetical protein
MFKLSEKEIRQKFIKLNNYENILHPQLKERNTRLREENKDLKKRMKEMEKENSQVQKILLELEELKEMQY